jgi:hypothetical protein
MRLTFQEYPDEKSTSCANKDSLEIAKKRK